MPVSASRTSSSLNGLMMAMTSFMKIPRLGPFTRLETGQRLGLAAEGAPTPALLHGEVWNQAPCQLDRGRSIDLERMTLSTDPGYERRHGVPHKEAPSLHKKWSVVGTRCAGAPEKARSSAGSCRITARRRRSRRCECAPHAPDRARKSCR